MALYSKVRKGARNSLDTLSGISSRNNALSARSSLATPTVLRDSRLELVFCLVWRRLVAGGFWRRAIRSLFVNVISPLIGSLGH